MRELEGDVDAENRRHLETTKVLRKHERKVKELQFQVDEDRRVKTNLQELIDKLQGKLNTYKRQAEEAVSGPITILSIT